MLLHVPASVRVCTSDSWAVCRATLVGDRIVVLGGLGPKCLWNMSEVRNKQPCNTTYRE